MKNPNADSLNGWTILVLVFTVLLLSFSIIKLVQDRNQMESRIQEIERRMDQ